MTQLRLSCIVALSALTAATTHAQIAGSFVTSGAGCPSSSLLYEQFPSGNFDLAGTALEWIPNGSLGYLVIPVANPTLLPFGYGTNLSLGNNQVSAPVPLGFAFPYPTRSQNLVTQQIEVTDNGYVYLEPGTISSTRCCQGNGTSFRSFINDTASWAVMGMNHDLGAGGAVWVDSTTTVTYVTWDAVLETTQMNTNTFQIQFFADGRVVTAWGAGSQNAAHVALVGWSGGNRVIDDGPIDFSSSVPFNMGPSSGPLTISAPRGVLPTTGQSFTIDVSNVPSDAVAGALLFGATSRNLPLDLLGMPGCNLMTSADIATWPISLMAPTGSATLSFPTTPGTAGLRVEIQAAMIAASVNTFGLSTSNLGTLTVGDINPVVVQAIGGDSMNNVVTSGFWNVINGTSLGITSVEFDWATSSIPNSNRFDTDQAGMADRFDGGNSTTPLCANTYRNGSDALTGLVYQPSTASGCSAGAQTGWVGSILVGPGDYRRLRFDFTSFDPGDVFEVDIDTDGGGVNAGAMAGMVITVTMSDGSIRTGELGMINFNLAQANL